MDYSEFLQQKVIADLPSGLSDVPELNSNLFGFQAAIVKWALRRGRAAIFADCGLGKTIMQLEWARCVPGKVLILTPLAVAKQTEREGAKFGIDARYARSHSDDDSKITITNYEMLDRFDVARYNAVVLDESSILKSFDGKFRGEVIAMFAKTPYRLACTATPAPNDFMELGNHSAFLGVMPLSEMLSCFFVHDGGETQKWRLKGHAQGDFWRWICSWAINIRKPSDIGFDDAGFDLPRLNIEHKTVRASTVQDGYLFPMAASTMAERLSARRDTAGERAQLAADIVAASPGERWLIWCNLNSEADAIRKLIPGATEVRGSDSPESKESALMGFVEGSVQYLITKPSIAGFGMNFQCCHNVIFVGLNDSYEQFYQAIRRCWRFGQQHEVNVHVISADIEGAVVANIKRKEADSERLANEMVAHMADISKAELNNGERIRMEYKTRIESGHGWTLKLGDCVEMIEQEDDESIHYSVFSPPFSSLYTYTNSDRDMGNCRNDGEFLQHFTFLVQSLWKKLIPGRLVSFHCMNLPTSKQHNGYIGIRDFRGDLIRLFESCGFIYHSEVCIWKDPVIAMQRTKALGLLHKQLKKDSCMSRQGIPDYLVTMRKPGDNPERVTHTNETFPVQLWQKYASPIWMDINPSDTLQYRSAREHEDEKHICPLQLTIIRRAIELWTNPGDVVLSPFAGIGSEGYVACSMNRKFIGYELKESYFNQAAKNLLSAGQESLPIFSYQQDDVEDATWTQ
jgi:superfamily II DNA or RNA helicase